PDAITYEVRRLSILFSLFPFHFPLSLFTFGIMKIALIGYGKMGKAIEKIATERGHEIALRVTSSNKNELTGTTIQQCDVAIEFTGPETAAENIIACL